MRRWTHVHYFNHVSFFLFSRSTLSVIQRFFFFWQPINSNIITTILAAQYVRCCRFCWIVCAVYCNAMGAYWIIWSWHLPAISPKIDASIFHGRPPDKEPNTLYRFKKGSRTKIYTQNSDRISSCNDAIIARCSHN